MQEALYEAPDLQQSIHMHRIAMISLHTCPFERLGMFDAGGMNAYVANLTKSLAKQGWEVDIFTRDHAQAHEKPCCHDQGIQVIHIPLSGGVSLPKAQLISHTDRFAEQILSYMHNHKKRYTLFHAHYYLSGLTALSLKKQLHIPVIQTFHTLDRLKKRYGGAFDDTRFHAEKTIIREAEAIIASTQQEKNDFIRLYDTNSRRIHIIAPGVDTRLFHPRDKRISRKQLKLAENKPIILFVGRIDPIKDISTLIRAVDLLAKKHEGFTDQFSVLLIGGDTKTRSFWKKPEVQKIQNIIQKKQLDCCVKFIGAVPHRQLPAWFSAADIVVLPSLYESFGLVILEAMASGTATIASRVGGLTRIIEDGKNGVLFPPQNADILAEKIWSLLTNEQLRQKLSRNALAYAQNFSWDKQVMEFVRVYTAITTV